MAGPFGEVGGEEGMWGEPTYLWVAIICSTRRNHFSKVNNKPHYRLQGEKYGEVGGAWGWSWEGGWSLASVRRVSRCGWSKADALATKVGAFTCLKSLLYARYVCAAPAPAPAATTTTWNTLLIMLMLLDEFRVTKQEEAQNLHRHAIFFFLQEQQKKHEGKTEKRMRNKNRKWSCCQRRWWRWWDETVCHRMAEQVLQRRQRQIQL